MRTIATERSLHDRARHHRGHEFLGDLNTQLRILPTARQRLPHDVALIPVEQIEIHQVPAESGPN